MKDILYSLCSLRQIEWKLDMRFCQMDVMYSSNAVDRSLSFKNDKQGLDIDAID